MRKEREEKKEKKRAGDLNVLRKKKVSHSVSWWVGIHQPTVGIKKKRQQVVGGGKKRTVGMVWEEESGLSVPYVRGRFLRW